VALVISAMMKNQIFQFGNNIQRKNIKERAAGELGQVEV
jgi:hypothetical protein